MVCLRDLLPNNNGLAQTGSQLFSKRNSCDMSFGRQSLSPTLTKPCAPLPHGVVGVGCDGSDSDVLGDECNNYPHFQIIVTPPVPTSCRLPPVNLNFGLTTPTQGGLLIGGNPVNLPGAHKYTSSTEYMPLNSFLMLANCPSAVS